MTIDELKAKKAELEQTILEATQKFSNETRVGFRIDFLYGSTYAIPEGVMAVYVRLTL